MNIAENPLISVIVPVYGVEKYLDRCIESVVNQTYRNLEIILVDDGSPDRCPEICDLWAAKDRRVKVIHKPNGGLSSARNAGLDVCQGAYISFADSDDWLEADMLEMLLNACREQDAPISVCGRYVVTGGEKSVDKCFSKNEVLDAAAFTARMLTGKQCDCSACDKLYQRELWRDIRFPDGRIFEDIAIMYRVILQSHHVAVINKPLYNYYRHGTSITKAAFGEKWFDYPNNTRNMLRDIQAYYPELYEYACWPHMKAIQAVLYKLALADRKTYKKYICEFKALSGEMLSYKHVWKQSEVFSNSDRRMCEFFSASHVIRLAYGIKRALRK